VSWNEKLYIIESKTSKFICLARNKKEAYAKFFLKVLNGEIPLEEIGLLITLYEGKHEYGLRTVPILYLLGVIDLETAIYNIQKPLGISREEALQLLKMAVEQDKWIIDEMKKVYNEEIKKRRLQ
jgi:hypothetical protein